MGNRFAAAGLPVDDFKVVAAKIKGDGSISFNKAFESATWIQGYAGSFIPDGEQPIVPPFMGAMEEDKQLEFIGDQFLELSQARGQTEAIDWKNVLGLATTLLKLWLKF